MPKRCLPPEQAERGTAVAIADVTDVPVVDLLSLAGRGAVVTGGAQGLGRAMARRLAEAGASVVIGDLKLDAARASARELSERYGRRVIATHLDVADSASIEAAAALALK